MRENGGEITISIFGKVTFVGDDDILYDDADAFLDCIREEFSMNVNREMLAFLRKQYPVGTRIRLDSMQDPYAPVEAGTTGNWTISTTPDSSI